MSERAELVLVADDDEDILRFVEVNLRLEGFSVASASDGDEALAQAVQLEPDLVLLDVMMPTIDGFEVCKRLRGHERLRDVSVIMLTAKSLPVDKVLGLTAGADDYIVKPFDPRELVARVKSVLRRTREPRRVDPLTRLPTNVEVREEVARRVADGIPFALMYSDLDNFKAFNDRYGFMRGDEAIKLFASCVRDVVRRFDERAGFVGHIGGDDVVAIVDPAVAERAAREMCSEWDRCAPPLYDDEDAGRGYVEVRDRRDQVRRFPLATVSIGIASTATRPLDSHWAAAEIATEMKRYAKSQRGSTFAIDRRRAVPRPA